MSIYDTLYTLEKAYSRVKLSGPGNSTVYDSHIYARENDECKHSIKFGTDVRRTTLNSDQCPATPVTTRHTNYYDTTTQPHAMVVYSDCAGTVHVCHLAPTLEWSVGAETARAHAPNQAPTAPRVILPPPLLLLINFPPPSPATTETLVSPVAAKRAPRAEFATNWRPCARTATRTASTTSSTSVRHVLARRFVPPATKISFYPC